MEITCQCNTLSPAITAATAESAMQVKEVGVERRKMKWSFGTERLEHLGLFVIILLCQVACGFRTVLVLKKEMIGLFSWIRRSKEEAIQKERERESSDGDQTQALNINAACLRELRAAVHQKLGERAREDTSITSSQSWRCWCSTVRASHKTNPLLHWHVSGRHHHTWPTGVMGLYMLNWNGEFVIIWEHPAALLAPPWKTRFWMNDKNLKLFLSITDIKLSFSCREADSKQMLLTSRKQGAHVYRKKKKHGIFHD